MKKIISIILLLTTLPTYFYGLHLQSVGIDTIKESVLPSSTSQIKFFIGENSLQKKNLLDALQMEYRSMLDKEKQLAEALDKLMHSLKNDIDVTKSDLADSHNTSHDFLSKKLDLLNKKYQFLPEIRDVRQQIAETIKFHIEYLDKYFKSIDDESSIEEKSLYAFSDLQKLTHQIMLEKEKVSRLHTKKENEESVIARTEGIVTIKDKEIKSLIEVIESFKKSTSDSKNHLNLFDLEKETLLQERDFASLKIESYLKTIDFLDSQMFVMTNKVSKLEVDLINIRSRMKVDMHDVLQYQKENKDVKKDLQALKADLMKKRTDLTLQKTYKQQELEKIADRYKYSLSNVRQIEEWEFTINSISEGFVAFSVALEQVNIIGLEQQVENVKIELLKLDSKITHAQVLEDSVQSLYSITQAKFSDSDQLDKERIKYKDLKNSIEDTIKLYQNRMEEIHDFIKNQYKKLHNIKKDQKEFKSYKSEDVAANQRKHNEGLAFLSKASKAVEVQGDLSLKISEQYSSLIEEKEESLNLVNFILQELDLIGVWHRSNRAVTIDGFTQIIPNLITFAQNVYSILMEYIVHTTIVNDIYNLATNSFTDLFFYLLMFIFLYFIYLSLQTILPALFNGFMLIDSEKQGVFVLSRILAVICGFLQQSLAVLFVWFLLFAYIYMYQLSIAFTLIFYGFSIFFLTYMSRVFLFYLVKFNRSIDYVLLGQSFEERFIWIFSFFSASTITILFFRKMFMLVMLYQKSEFPIILLRLYHVVIFISVVFSIEKEELLNLIPKNNVYLDTLNNLIDSYYYLLSLFCVMILILSDPYLGGYGHLIWYVILNSTMSIILFALIYLMHMSIKMILSWMFFKDRGEFGLKERFEYAKASYAISIVSLSIISFGFLALLMAHLWGYTILYAQIEKFLSYPAFTYYGGATGTKIEYLRVAGCIRLVISVFMGYLFAFLWKRYILQKVFEIQYVDPGIQDTIITISRYLIIVITILIGFVREGLGSVALWVLGFGLLTFGWSFKDFLADIVAYFFILVQRLIKVGDYIKLDKDIIGVVKKITPRAVILRTKNSVTIIVPNSIILKRSLSNWNYTRGYIAFPDIIFTVPFHTDPVRVKEMLSEVLQDHSDVLKLPEPIIRLDDLSDHGYKFMVRGFISSGNTLNQWGIASDIRLLIAAALSKEGMQIAEPVLRIKNEN